ncbi:hypothetical protein [Cellulomonas sp.]|uniref:hypothetical protein n=1 Tax=Cellulomonas sp. TaxID=40001 RepID=UPI003BAA702C
MQHSTGRMRLAVSATDGSGFAGALYLRDRFAPTALPGIPALDPPVPPAREVETGTEADWDAWWALISVAEIGRVVPPPEGSVLAGLYEAHEDDLIRWVAGHESDEVIGSYLPQWLPPVLEAGSGQGAHSTEVIPVLGTWWTSLTPRRLLVSTTAFADTKLMDRLWRERIDALLTPVP